MYQDHFGLLQEPFSIAPDPSFLFLSESHNEALAHLLYGFSHGGFVLISGEVGTGKTTLLRNLLDRTPADVDVAFILNPRLTVRELLETLCEELGVAKGASAPESVKQYIDLLNRHLLRTHQSGRSTVVVIDEAQNLSPAVLEQIRLLTNLETNEKKLLRIILLGQPELLDMLAKSELRQLSQRITARYHLTPLSREDTHKYVTHRLARAGGNPNIFSTAALNSLYGFSKGIPRLVNIIADRAMLGAYATNEHKVTPKLVRGAAAEVFGKRSRVNKQGIIGLLLGVVVIAMLWAGWGKYQEQADTRNVTGVSTTIDPVGRAEVSNAPLPAQAETVVDNGEQQQKPSTTTSSMLPSSSQNTPVNASTNPGVSLPVAVARPDGATYALHRQAFAAVFELWGTHYADTVATIPCDFAPQVGLQCLRKTGGWREVQALNMPIVMELWDERADPFYGALVGSEQGAYKLALGQETLLVAPRDLRDAWFGAYVLLWRTPPGYSGSLRLGDRHPSVGWLREQLADIQSVPTSTQPLLFDEALHQQVVRFQEDEGLIADGVVGPMTWIKINNHLPNNAPKLVP